MEDAGISQPLFVSIGDAEKLQTFLDINPFVSKEQMFVDGYDFQAYKDAGFKSFTEQDPEIAKSVKLAAPEMGGFEGWWKYFTNVMKLSPIPSDGSLKFGDVPEGVLRLGGTFVVKGDEIIYQWSDRVPGDHPNVKEVCEIAIEAASSKKPNVVEDFLNNIFR